MRDAAAKIGSLFHVLVIDVRLAEISSDAREHHNVGFANGLGEAVCVADLDAI
jgi:hypothetical protein